jgi:small subunit ribosomal protein S17e
MGRIKTSLIKNLGEELIKRYKFEQDFDKVKNKLNEMNIFQSKRVRNKVAGYIVRSLKVRGGQ